MNKIKQNKFRKIELPENSTRGRGGAMAEVQITIANGGWIWDRILGSVVIIAIIKIRPNYPSVYADRSTLRGLRTDRVLTSALVVLTVDLHAA